MVQKCTNRESVPDWYDAIQILHNTYTYVSAV